MTQIPQHDNLDFPSLYENSLALLASLVLSLRENSEEMNAVYTHFLVRQQFNFNQKVLWFFPAEDSASVSRSFWSSVYLLPENFRLSHYIANRTRVGYISKVYMTYWMKCFKAIAKFYGNKQPRLYPCIFSPSKLVLDNTAASFGLKWRCHSVAEDNNVPGDSFQSVKKSRATCDCEGNFSRQNES